MPALFSTQPLMQRLLTIAQEEAAKRGHIIESYDRIREREEVVYTSQCKVCHATVRILCSAHQYLRTGTAYNDLCKPG